MKDLLWCIIWGGQIGLLEAMFCLLKHIETMFLFSVVHNSQTHALYSILIWDV